MTIDRLASVDPAAKIGEGCRIGPFCVVGPEVTLGPGCILDAGSQVIGRTTLGAENVLRAHAVLGGMPQDRKHRGEPSAVEIGDRNIFSEGVTVHRGTTAGSTTRLGSDCYLMVNSHVGHNCVIADGVTLVNSAQLGGHATVGAGAIIGAHTAIHQFCRVGRLAMLSNSSDINVDLPPFFLSMRTNTITQLNAVGMRRSGMSRATISAVRQVFQLAFRSALPLRLALEQLPPELAAVPEVREIIEFCNNSKRGVARFAAWSSRGGMRDGADDAAE